MIVLTDRQGSVQWLRSKIGIPSASNFSKILTPAKLTASTSSNKYAYQLLAEKMLGRPIDDKSTSFMDRGTGLEAEARAWYEFHTGNTVKLVGFCLRDDRRAGCSPDGLVDDDGGVEIKCPKANTHVGYLLGHEALQYKLQIQGGMYITGRKWWDFVSFNPELGSCIVRYYRDDDVMKALDKGLRVFIDEMDSWERELREDGYSFADPDNYSGEPLVVLDDAA